MPMISLLQIKISSRSSYFNVLYTSYNGKSSLNIDCFFMLKNYCKYSLMILLASSILLLILAIIFPFSSMIK